MASAEKIIEVSGLVKDYGTFRAVDHLSLDVYKGDVFGFLGPNGAGKSTTIRMLLSLIKPTEGRISIFGMDLSSNRNSILKQTGSIVEKPDFYKYLSARKNLELIARISGPDISPSRIDYIFALVGLKGRERDLVKGYSHGMRQRLGLGAALLHNPDLIVLDEPTTGLDPQGIIDIRNLISYLQKEEGKTIVLSSHLLSEIELIANRMVIINNGKTIVQGVVKELLHADDLIVNFSVDNIQKMQNYLQDHLWAKKLISNKENVFTFSLSKKEVVELNATICENGIGVEGIEAKRKLEDLFLKMINDN